MTKAVRVVTLIAMMVLFSAVMPRVRAQSTVNLVVEGGSSGQTETDAINAVLDKWNKAHPDMPAKFIPLPDPATLNKDLASGNPPDVFYVDSNIFLDLVKSGALAPIGDKLENADDFIPALREVFTTGGKFYCPPKDFSTLALQINTDMMKAAGIEKPPTTWDELAADAKAMTKGDVAGFMTPSDAARWLAWLYQAGGSVTNDAITKMTINSPEAVTALKYYTGLYTDGYAKKPADVGAGWPGEAFEKGKVAMIAEGNWVIGDIAKNAPNLKYISAPLPAGPKGQATMVFTVCYGAAAQGKHLDAATQLINFLVSPESMQSFTETLGVMPARQSLRESWLKKYPDFQVYLDSTQFAHRWGFAPNFSTVTDAIGKQLDLVEAGQTTAEDALAEIEKTGNEVLAKSGMAAGGDANATMGAVDANATMSAGDASATMAATMAATTAP